MVDFNIRTFVFKVLLVILTMTYNNLLWGQDSPKVEFGKGINFTSKDNSFSTKFHLRFQSLFVYTYDEENESSSSQFLIRRSRLKFDGFVLSKKVKYKVELGLSNRDISVNKEDGNTRDAARIILDAVLKWQFAKHWSLWVGQTKLPGNRERVISSANLQFVDRSLVNSRYNIDRDAGLQLRGKYTLGKAIFAPSFAISQGEGRNITSENFGGYDYTFHLDFLPFGTFTNKKGDYISSDLERSPKPKLAIGFTYDYNDGAVRSGGQLGSFVKNAEGDYIENSLSTIFVDMMFKYKGFSVMSAYADKRSGNPLGVDSLSVFNTGTGFNAQLGYLTPIDLELAVRYTTVMRDHEFSGIKNENQYTFGVSRYIVGHSLKFQSDITRITFPGKQGRYQFRMQLEMQF